MSEVFAGWWKIIRWNRLVDRKHLNRGATFSVVTWPKFKLRIPNSIPLPRGFNYLDSRDERMSSL
eukprot:6178731-Pleurochrysis_carterae.AAC.1